MNATMRYCIAAIMIVFSVTMIQGCKEDLIADSNIINLKDPAVQPAVIFTYPQSGTQGPYKNILNGYDGIGSYHFFLQFNKLMDSYTFSSSTVSIEGFNESVYVTRDYNDAFTDILRFRVINTNVGTYARYIIGKKYTVRVKSTVQDIHGYTLAGDFDFSFTPEPSFRVVSSYPPSGLTEEGSFSPWLRFNSKVNSTLVSSLTISPQVVGNWVIQYYDSTMIQFVPTSDFIQDTPYTIALSAGAKDALNNPIIKPYSFSFTKKNAFKVQYTSMSSINGQAALYFSFNGPLDTTTISSGFSITPSIPGRIYFNYSIYNFFFIPDSSFIPGASYSVSLLSSIKSQQGVPLQPHNVQFNASGFSITNFFPSQYSDVSQYTAIELRTNYDVDTSTVKGSFSISPATAGTLIAYRNYIHFVPSQILQPSTLYTITISTALKTKTGYPLGQSGSFSFRTVK